LDSLKKKGREKSQSAPKIKQGQANLKRSHTLGRKERGFQGAARMGKEREKSVRE